MVGQQVIFGLYPSRLAAARAVARMKAGGIDGRDVVTLDARTHWVTCQSMLTAMGVPEREAHAYAEQIRDGGALVFARSCTLETSRRARQHLDRTGARWVSLLNASRPALPDWPEARSSSVG
jgi:hypothetical protein